MVLLHVIEEIPLPTSLIFDDIAVINRGKKDCYGDYWKKDGISWSRLRPIRSKMITWLCAVNVEMGQPQSRSCGSLNNKMDMIVMGSHRLKGISKIKALGSVTRKVSEIADCPVLIVH